MSARTGANGRVGEDRSTCTSACTDISPLACTISSERYSSCSVRLCGGLVSSTFARERGSGNLKDLSSRLDQEHLAPVAREEDLALPRLAVSLVHLEKTLGEMLANVRADREDRLRPVCDKWQVPLVVARGNPSV